VLKRIGKSTIVFNNLPIIKGFSSVVGKKEGDGPLGGCFDFVSPDDTFGQTTFEKAESAMIKDAVNIALNKAGYLPKDINYIFAGDLLNQCIGSNYGLRELGIQFFGLYGACSTMSEAISLSAMAVNGEFAKNCIAVTSSHFCSAERQFRFPLEYGGQRTGTAQWTVTGSGAVVVSNSGKGVKIAHCTVGKINDLGIKDVNNMGAAMAPAAAQTLSEFFIDTNTKPQNYDLIVTGDLAQTGSLLLKKLLSYEGYDLKENYNDCGILIYNQKEQDVHSGGSGCGCSAVVLTGHIIPRMLAGQLENVLFIGTGALMSPTSILQGESIPSIAHLVHFTTN